MGIRTRKIRKKELGFIHNFIPSTKRTNEVILLLHGTGGDEKYLLKIGRRISPGAAVLTPRGNVFDNGSNRFCLRSPDGVFDMADLKLRTDELAKFIRNAAKLYKFDLSRLSVIGYSNGASIAAAVILTHPGTVKRCVLFHPALPLMPETLPDLSSIRVLITYGDNDKVVKPGESQALANVLKQCRAQVVVYRHSAQHELEESEILAAKTFLAS